MRVFGAALVIVTIVVVILWTTQGEDPVTTVRPTRAPLDDRIPPIDAVAADRVATASFALG